MITKQVVAPLVVVGIGLGMFTCLQPSVAAPDVIDLATTYGLKVVGADTNDLSGFSVAGAGDVNKDGIGDVIIGAPIRDLPQGRWFAGSAYVLYGSATPTNIDLLTLTSAQGFQIEGAGLNNWTGRSVSPAGDVNGDGFDDVALGAPYATGPAGRSLAGKGFVIFGSAAGATVDLRNLDPQQGFAIIGANNGDQIGVSVSGAGDFNGDGFQDVVVGAPEMSGNGQAAAGRAYVVFGSGQPDTVDLQTLTKAQGIDIQGAVVGDKSGRAVSGAGDLNADGKSDILIGAPFADPGSRTDAGRVYVVYGSTSPGNVNLAQLGAQEGFTIDGAAPDDAAGRAVAAARDINGDGKPDVVVGAPGAGTDAGSSYVVFGKASPTDVDLASLPSSQGFAIHGATAGDNSGNAVAGVGDVNGDGFRDVAVGAPKAAGLGRQNAGASYVVFGSASPSTVNLASMSGSQGITAVGAAADNESGFSVAGAGDVNGDGKPDVLIGAPYAEGSASSAGLSYVIFGTTPPPTPPPTPSPSLSPSLTPTPTPTPTVIRRKLPLKVKAKYGKKRYTPSTWTALVTRSTTNEFGTLKYRVSARRLRASSAGEVEYATWKTTSKGAVLVRVRGYETVRVRIWIKAVPKPDARSLWKSNQWKGTWTLQSR